MNDRCLYRAKRLDNGEWITGSLIQADYIGTVRSWISSEQDDKARLREISSNQAVWRAFEVRTDTICQCTGLKDKNGKLIWENDIVRYTDMITGAEKIDSIEWNEIHASFVRLHRSKMGLQYLNIDEYIANGCEFIGNVFDNPELLEVGE